MNKKTKELIVLAKANVSRAYAPYSYFAVSAALEGISGTIYTGVNIENSSYGLSICAERVAIYKAVSEGEKRFRSLVICAGNNSFIYPCGACRQVMAEFSPQLEIILVNSRGKTKVTNLKKLLPHSFVFKGRKL